MRRTFLLVALASLMVVALIATGASAGKGADFAAPLSHAQEVAVVNAPGAGGYAEFWVTGSTLNYRVTVVEDGCFDRAQANHAINLCDMHAKYANVLPSEEVIAHLQTLSQGMFDLPSGAGMTLAAE